jgi:hypothetical protein
MMEIERSDREVRLRAGRCIRLWSGSRRVRENVLASCFGAVTSVPGALAPSRLRG